MPGSAAKPSHPGPQGPLRVAAGIVWWRARVVVQRRPPAASHGGGRLELPGGKLEPGESAVAALARELTEEWGPVAKLLQVGDEATTVRHRYPPPGPDVLLYVHHVDAGAWPDTWRDRLELDEGAAVEVYPPGELPLMDFLEADREVVTNLLSGELDAP